MSDTPRINRIEDLRRRAESDPASIVFAALAEEYRRAGRLEEAIATCRAGLEHHPTFLSARVTLGRALIEVGELEEATDVLEHVLNAAPENLAAILEQLANIPLPVVLPMHPRTEGRIAGFGLSELLTGIQTVKPVGYEEFLGLSAECSFLISDSGGVQEEASILKRPVLVVRRSTERPEVLGTFAERVLPGPEIGRVARGWIDDLSALHHKLADLPSPYGDGTAAEKSVAAIDRLLGGR